ncbi:hypothetical protein ARMGADRAFT_147874 [Armillaria gallica]|uniref:Uncharacterized protein n=1 Tax=Armillaria gallica TaxID=47427 RepID=A0A2H3DD23_ARMGA|nr:hypothetical protein ARMGADRAFT_147874 [Armillaria gallica]
MPVKTRCSRVKICLRLAYADACYPSLVDGWPRCRCWLGASMPMSLISTAACSPFFGNGWPRRRCLTGVWVLPFCSSCAQVCYI